MHPRSIPFLLCFCLIGLNALAQDARDSLIRIWNDGSRHDTIRFNAYNDLVWDHYLFSDPDTAYIMAQAFLEEARAKGSHVYEAMAFVQMASSYYVRGKLNEALEEFEVALALFKKAKNEKGIADVLTNMGAVRLYLGQHDEALDLYQQGLKVHIKLNDSTAIANDINAMGAIEMARGDLANAAELYTEALHILEKLKNKRGVATGLSNLGALQMQQGDYKSALERYREALRITLELNDQHLVGKDQERVGSCLQELGDTSAAMDLFRQSLATRVGIDDAHGVVNAHNAIGELLLVQHKQQWALDHFKLSIPIAESEELLYGWASALIGAGKALLGSGRLQEATTMAEKASIVANEVEDIMIERDAAELRYRVLKAMRRYPEALAMHERYVALNDSVMSENNQREVLRNAFRYDYERQALIDSVSHMSAMQESSTVHQIQMSEAKTRIDQLLIAGGLLGLIALAIWWRSKLLKRTNALILSAQEKLMQSEREKEAGMVRTRIASDIHDELGGELTKITLLASEISGQHTDPARLRQQMERISLLSRDAIAALSDIVHAVDPAHDSANSLVTQAEHLAQRMLENAKSSADLQFHHEGGDHRVDPATRHDLLMLLKEALNNAIKHANAEHITASLVTNGATFKLVVSDNGNGFDPTMVDQGNGTRNMRRRVARCNAELAIDAVPGKGCRITVEGRFA